MNYKTVRSKLFDPISDLFQSVCNFLFMNPKPTCGGNERHVLVLMDASPLCWLKERHIRNVALLASYGHVSFMAQSKRERRGLSGLFNPPIENTSLFFWSQPVGPGGQ